MYWTSKSCHQGLLYLPTDQSLTRLFNVGLGRPSTIQDKEISAAVPSTQHGAELEPWSTTSPLGHQTVFPSSHVVSNVRATIQLFKITSSALDEMYDLTLLILVLTLMPEQLSA